MSGMRTGICTTDFEPSTHLPYSADTLFGKISAMGYTCTQFSFSSISETEFSPNGQIEIPHVIPSSAVSAAEKASAKFSVPICVINGTFNMAHPDEEVRAEGLRRLSILMDAANSLGCRMISLCSGSGNRDHLWRPSPENTEKSAWDRMFSTMVRAVEEAEHKNIILAIESEASNVIQTPETARRVMDEIGSDKLKMILDCANLFHRGTAHPENVRDTISRAFDYYGDDIVIAHGKDIREGDGIDFCGTGLGIVDFGFTAMMLKKYGYTGDMFLHGIYDEDYMPKAREFWEKAVLL